MPARFFAALFSNHAPDPANRVDSSALAGAFRGRAPAAARRPAGEPVGSSIQPCRRSPRFQPAGRHLLNDLANLHGSRIVIRSVAAMAAGFRRDRYGISRSSNGDRKIRYGS
ncbi:hypothetical protein DF051_14235 [Burkholderia contaminans]|uniref:Uncharacterized protein n=1 Tax=Burkholderia contaminans TaxID=488447 RepID=A0A3N8PZC6_9BURK|nr:hypothetical protein DF051_14235 [Burkholderia contaminans]